MPETTAIPEREFQRRTADLVQRYDVAHETKQGEDAWHREWEDLLVEASDAQGNRALDLLTLHIQNKYPPLTYDELGRYAPEDGNE